MRIAVTYEDGQVFQHFGHTERFQVYDVQDGAVSRRNVLIGPNDGTSIMVLAGLDPGVPVAVN